MFYLWDGNHQLQAWMPYIFRIHPHDLSWHIAMDSILLDTRESLVHLFTTMTNMNK
jgi:hypothetical protein